MYTRIMMLSVQLSDTRRVMWIYPDCVKLVLFSGITQLITKTSSLSVFTFEPIDVVLHNETLAFQLQCCSLR